MSILDKFNNPDPGKAQLNRFTGGEIPPAGDTYQVYGVNDQHSLANSKLHYCYSNEGNPVINLGNNNYNASPKRPFRGATPTNLSVINDGNSGFSQEYNPNNKYTDGITTTIR